MTLLGTCCPPPLVKCNRSSHNFSYPLQERRLCAHPFLEIYQEGRIHFMSPLARQGDFYVPEVRRIERRLSEEDGLHSDSDVSGWCTCRSPVFIDTNRGAQVPSKVQCKLDLAFPQDWNGSDIIKRIAQPKLSFTDSLHYLELMFHQQYLCDHSWVNRGAADGRSQW